MAKMIMIWQETRLSKKCYVSQVPNIAPLVQEQALGSSFAISTVGRTLIWVGEEVCSRVSASSKRDVGGDNKMFMKFSHAKWSLTLLLI